MKNRLFELISEYLGPVTAWLSVQILTPTARHTGRLVDRYLTPAFARFYARVLTPSGHVLWRVVAFVAALLSFGALDLNKKRLNKGSIARVWGFFWPFLLSREEMPITIPEELPVPVFNGWASPFGAGKLYTLLAYVFAAAGFVVWCSWGGLAFTESRCGAWMPSIMLAAGIFFVLSILKSLPAPAWKRGSLPLPKSVHGIAFGGRTLVVLPEWCKTWSLLALIGLGIYLVNYYAVQINTLNGDFMNSITSKNAAQFSTVLRSFGIVLAIFTVLGPVSAWIKQVLILDFSKFSTRFMMRLQTLNRNFYPVSLLGKPDNPNERIQQDVPAMCSASLQFMFVTIDSLITFYLFGGILWAAERGLVYKIPLFGHVFPVQHLLLLVLVGYALIGSNGVVRVGWRLIKLQFDQKRLGADFRVGMVMFEKYAEPIAAYRGEQREYNHLWWRFMLTLKNNYAIIRWQRNLGFFTSGYDRIAALLPYAALAPFYFAGKIMFGTISRAVGAFGEILSSASIFVSGFSSLTNLMSSIDRVGELRDALEDLAVKEADGLSRVKVEEGELLDIEGLTLYTPDRAKVIVRDFNLNMVPGRNVAIIGPSGSGKTSILRAIVGLPLWDRGEGTIKVASKIGQTMMLTQLAYLPSDATLREQIQYPSSGHIDDERLLGLLRQVNLADLAQRVGGLDTRYNWDSLSGGERQRLVIARALLNKVRLVIADEATSGLDTDNEEKLYQYMVDAGITLLSVTHKATVVRFHQEVVQLLGDGKGGWRNMPASESPLHE